MPFSPLGLRADVLRGVHGLGFTRPTPIQQDAIPPAVHGRDVLACAVTGSGKTAAFLLPILHRLVDKPRGTTRALVLSPTRELAGQTAEHFRALAAHTPLSVAVVMGGVGMTPQEHAFRRGVDVVIATPGRLLDHCRFPYARLHGVEILVLDEADRMLDMGFLPDVRRILRHIPARRQTLFFSATLPAPVVSLSREMLKDPVAIQVDRNPTPAAGITHAAYPVPAELKSALLLELVKRGGIRSAIAFTRTKHRANRLADYLLRNGVPAGRIHGSRSQSQRDQALRGFRAGKFPVLVATDIAARGIDIDALSHVVNFDVPGCPEDYVHRVGRTARAEARGDALVLVSPQEEGDLRGIERAIGERLQRVTVPGFDYTARSMDRLGAPPPLRRAEAHVQPPRRDRVPHAGSARPNRSRWARKIGRRRAIA